MELSRIKRHFYFCFFSVLAAITIGFLVHEDSITKNISISTAYVSMLYFVAALSVGPVNLLLSKANPISVYLRRDLGIWSAMLAIIHIIAGLQVHLLGKMWLYFLNPADKQYIFPIRYDPFGLTNHLGLICGLIMIFLLMISNNQSIKWLSARKWKKWQRSSYFLAFAIPLHGVIYQILEKRIGIYTIILASLFMLIVLIQVFGMIQYRKKSLERNN